MQKHGFVGVQSIYTRAILANKKKYNFMLDFFCGRRAPIICGGGGGTCPLGPPPPVATPLIDAPTISTSPSLFTFVQYQCKLHYRHPPPPVPH